MSQSPLVATPTASFEDGWRAINRRIREDGSWSSHERNVFYRNNGDGRFDNISGTVGLDLDQDGRAFAVFDYDLDGDPDILLKSRTGPQVHLLRNDFQGGNTSVSFRLIGVKSNRDAIGASVTVQTENGRQTKTVQAGSGFLSQHSKELLFGLGKANKIFRVTIEWPSGLRQTFNGIPVNHRIRIEEGNNSWRAEPFRQRNYDAFTPAESSVNSSGYQYTGTWLLEPYGAPDFSLKDLKGKEHRLSHYRGRPVLINFWASWCAPCREELKNFRINLAALQGSGASLLAVSVDEPRDREKVDAFARNCGIDFTIILADEEMVGLYNILNKYLFDKNENLQLPTTLLLDGDGEIVKIYRGPAEVAQILADLRHISASPQQRLRRALPFPGTFYAPPPGRNYFQLGIYFAEKGFTDPALAAFERAVHVSPNFAKAYYNLGTLHMKKNNLVSAKSALERALELQRDYPEAHNNLGSLLAETGQIQDAVSHFEAALASRPDYPDALNNLGYAYLQSGRSREAGEMFARAVTLEPDFPEALNNLGMLYAKEGEFQQAKLYFERALKGRPDYAEAANNLAMVYAATGLTEEAIRLLRQSLADNRRFEPTYLTLARVYAQAGRREEAAKVLQDLLRKNPNQREARELIQQFRLGAP